MGRYVVRASARELAIDLVGVWIEDDRLHAIYVDRKPKGRAKNPIQIPGAEYPAEMVRAIATADRLIDEVVDSYGSAGGALMLRALFRDQAGNLEHDGQRRVTLPLVGSGEGATSGAKDAGGGGGIAAAHLGRSVATSLDRMGQRLETAQTGAIDAMREQGAAQLEALRELIGAEREHSGTAIEQAITIQALEGENARIRMEHDLLTRIADLERPSILDALLQNPAEAMKLAAPLFAGLGALVTAGADYLDSLAGDRRAMREVSRPAAPAPIATGGPVQELPDHGQEVDRSGPGGDPGEAGSAN